MLIMHPVILVVAFLSGAVYSVMQSGLAKAAKSAGVMLPLILVTTVLNPVFNHRGITVLGYFPSGNPLTFEAVIYGVFSGIMLTAVIMWFSCFNRIFKSDKILYIFGKIAPSLALVLSMSLRFVPRFTGRLKQVVIAQKSLGRDIGNGKVKNRIKLGAEIVSSMMGWAMENSIETANSMKARGFSGGRRTSFSVYSFDKKDGILLSALVFCIIIFILFMGNGTFSFYPVFEFSWELPGVIAYSLICFAPILIDLMEVRKWK